MITAALVVAAAVDINRAAIQHVVLERHTGEHVRILIIHGDYALASGTSPDGPVHDGLILTRAGWHVACTFSPVPSATQLQSACKFPEAPATQLSASLAAQMAAQKGDFGTATIAETRAFATIRGPERDSERARVQLLHQLNEQLRTGMITRQQAIQRWNEFRLSWLLP